MNIYIFILHYIMILHRCKPQMSLFWIHNREESKAAFSQCASIELQDFQEICWMVLFRGCCGKNILMVSPWKVWIGPKWASDNGWRTSMGGIEGIAESVPCSSGSICRSPQEADPELVDGGERLRTEVGHAIHAPKVRWPRGWRDGRIGSWTKVFFSLLLTVRVLHSALSAIEKWYSSLVCFVWHFTNCLLSRTCRVPRSVLWPSYLNVSCEKVRCATWLNGSNTSYSFDWLPLR